MNKKILISLFALTLLSCNGTNQNSSNSEISSSEESVSIVSSEEVELSQIQLVEKIRNELIEFDDTVTSCTYGIEQEDYYGISIETSENGTKNLYKDNFLTVDFSQKIGRETIIGRREFGITGGLVSGYKIHEISYYGENDSENTVRYYEDNETNRSIIFDIGFVGEYINNILNTTLAYFEYEDARLSLITNFDQVDLSTDGEKLLQFRFISYSADGITKIEEVQRDDLLVIESGKIASCQTEMLYSLQDGINYQYMNKLSNYYYDELTSFEGTVLNPKDFE